MQVSHNKVVGLTYRLHQDTAEGQYIEEANDQAPLVFIFGVGQMLEDFEANIANKQIGDDFAFAIAAENAYGEALHEAIVDMPLSVFEGYEEQLQLNAFIPMRDAEDNQLNGRVHAMTDEMVTIDFNHPMAGINLHFTGKIVSIREADAHELSHGHVHGEHGVQH
jgi:FKBP-type peptidyl-prolyl cis-trans isomerase SlyD